jgi:SAM-dependent methyltransferase
MAAAQGPVLEIGVGTGRLFAEARRRRIDAWGIDLSPAMIACCRTKLAPEDRGRVSVADAVTMRPDRRFALVCAPFRVLSHVHEPGNQLRLLDAAHDCLLPGGAFVFDLYVPNLRMILDGVPEHIDFEGEHAPGRRLRRSVQATPGDLACQRNRVRMRFLWDEEDGEHLDEWTFEMRFFFRFEIEHLVARSKLVLDTIYGDFAGGPVTADSCDYVVLCRRPKG